MHWDATAVRPLPDFRIYVETAGGLKGVFDMKPYLDHGVFRELMDEAYFKRVEAIHYTIAHDDGVGWENWEAADIILADSAVTIAA